MTVDELERTGELKEAEGDEPGNPTTILVTGGAGYMGSRLVSVLATDERLEGATIRILDNLERNTFGSFGDLPKDGRYQFLEGDVLDPAAMRRALRGVDAVVHLAALVKTPFSFDHPTWTQHVNQWGTSRVVEKALEAEVERMLLASSASVYGPGKGFREEDDCQPVGPYSESKLGAERIVRTARDRGLETTILRFGTVFGDAPAVRFDAVPNSLAYQAAVGRSVTVHGEGEQERPVVHVDDAARAIAVCLAGAGETWGETFNVVGQNVTILEVAESLEELRPFVRVRHTAQDVMSRFSLTVDGSRFRTEGWRPRVSLGEGLSELLENYGRFEPVSTAGGVPEFDLA